MFQAPMGAPKAPSLQDEVSGYGKKFFNILPQAQQAGSSFFNQAMARNQQRDDEIANLSGNTLNRGGLNVLAQKPLTTQAAQPNPGDGYASGLQANLAEMIRLRNDRQAAFERDRSNFDSQYKFQAMANPWAAGNAGLEAQLSTNRGQYGEGLAAALRDAQRNAGTRNIDPKSDLYQNLMAQTRIQAAKGLSAMDTQARTDNYNRAAQFDTQQNQLQNAFNERRAAAMRADDLNQYNAAISGIQDIYSAQRQLPQDVMSLQTSGLSNDLARALMPYKVDEARMGNVDRQTRLDFLRPALQQQQQQGTYTLADLQRQGQMDEANLGPYLEALKWQYDNRWNTRSREAMNNATDDYLKLPKFGIGAAGSFIKGGGSF